MISQHIIDSDENEMLRIIDEFFGIKEAFTKETIMANKIKKAIK